MRSSKISRRGPIVQGDKQAKLALLHELFQTLVLTGTGSRSVQAWAEGEPLKVFKRKFPETKKIEDYKTKFSRWFSNRMWRYKKNRTKARETVLQKFSTWWQTVQEQFPGSVIHLQLGLASRDAKDPEYFHLADASLGGLTFYEHYQNDHGDRGLAFLHQYFKEYAKAHHSQVQKSVEDMMDMDNEDDDASDAHQGQGEEDDLSSDETSHGDHSDRTAGESRDFEESEAESDTESVESWHGLAESDTELVESWHGSPAGGFESEMSSRKSLSPGSDSHDQSAEDGMDIDKEVEDASEEDDDLNSPRGLHARVAGVSRSGNPPPSVTQLSAASRASLSSPSASDVHEQGQSSQGRSGALDASSMAKGVIDQPASNEDGATGGRSSVFSSASSDTVISEAPAPVEVAVRRSQRLGGRRVNVNF